MKHIMVTGGAGFIGSNFIHYMLKNSDFKIINFDALTYAGNPENLRDIEQDERYTFIKGNIADTAQVRDVLRKFEIDLIVNFAAETHVDRSILSPDIFVSANVLGTQNLLECARTYWSLSPEDKLCRAYKPGVRFIQVSTDEVYGSCHHTLLQQFWSLSISGKTDSADHLQQPPKSKNTCLRRRPAGAKLAVCGGSLFRAVQCHTERNMRGGL